MKFVLILITFASQMTFASASEVLVAKCGFPMPMFGPGESRLMIRPGTPFIYVFKSEKGLSVINSIAHTTDLLTERTTPLRGDLVAIPASSSSPVTWTQSNLVDFKKNDLGLSFDENLHPKQVGLITTTGQTMFTDAVYPPCFVWK